MKLLEDTSKEFMERFLIAISAKIFIKIIEGISKGFLGRGPNIFGELSEEIFGGIPARILDKLTY